MKKLSLFFILLIVLTACTSTKSQTGSVIDENLVYIDEVGPIMHDLKGIEVGSTIQMIYDGALMDSFPMQVSDSATFEKTGVKEHLLTSIMKIIDQLKMDQPQYFENSTTLNLTIDGISDEYRNLIVVMLSKRFHKTDILFDQKQSDAPFIEIVFDDISTHGSDQVIFSVELSKNKESFFVDQGLLNLNNGRYDVVFFSTSTQ